MTTLPPASEHSFDDTPLAWAHRFADAGIRVHPVYWIDHDFDEEGRPEESCACRDGVDCTSAGKHPIVSTSLSSTDHDQIDRWWVEYPEANLGMNTDGHTVVDVDPRNGGKVSYSQLQPDLLPTFVVQTGGGGWHEWYDGEVGKSLGKLAPGIDFKSGPSQQVVGPGSVHVSGLTYTVSRDEPIAPTPPRLLELAHARQPFMSEYTMGGKVPDGARQDALVLVAAIERNRDCESVEELKDRLRTYARHHFEHLDAKTEAKICEVAEHRWKHHDGFNVSLLAGMQFLSSVDENGRYVFDDGASLDSIIDGTWKPPKPRYLHRDDGLALFYAAAINYVFGEDSIGKTWVSLSTAVEVLNSGGKVVHLDWDDSFETNAYRLIRLGADPAAVRTRYLHKTSPGDVRPVGLAILAERADLVIGDVVANAVAAADLNEDKAGDYLAWSTDTAILWARGGACVILNDHVTKSSSGNAEYSRGSGAKRAGVDGASYELTAPVEMLPDEGGTLRLKLRKDRHGGVGARRGTAVADLHFDEDLRLTITESEPEVNAVAGLKMRAEMWIEARRGVPFTRKQLMDDLEVTKTPAANFIKAKVEVGWLVQVGTGNDRAYRRGVPEESSGVLEDSPG